MKIPKRWYLLLLVVLIAATIYVYQEILVAPSLTLWKLSVAKGEATLVKTPHGRFFLIDTGGDASVLRSLGETLPFWRRRLDAVFVTSTKSASGGMLAEIQQRYKVGAVVDSLAAGDRAVLDDGVSLEVLWPPLRIGSSKNAPDTAAAVSITYGVDTFRIEYNLSEKVLNWLQEQGPGAAVVISSTTPVGVYISKGVGID